MIFWLTSAWAALDPSCDELERPADYYEVQQQDFMMNHFALSSSFSALHGPVPHDGGVGGLGVEAAGIPPLNCYRRAAFDYTKHEDTNKSPVLPRLRGSFAFPATKWVPYVGVGFTPPVPVDGVASYLLSAELGFGVPLEGGPQLGARVHGSLLRSIGGIAGAIDPEDPEVDDLYVGSTLGFDASFGYRLGETSPAVPYVSLGITDVSTLFVVGDDGVIVSNFHPYFGPVGAVGIDALVDRRLRLGAELYAAPGGFSRPDGAPDDPADAPRGFGAYGHLYTARVQIAIELGAADKAKKKKKPATSKPPAPRKPGGK